MIFFIYEGVGKSDFTVDGKFNSRALVSLPAVKEYMRPTWVTKYIRQYLTRGGDSEALLIAIGPRYAKQPAVVSGADWLDRELEGFYQSEMLKNARRDTLDRFGGSSP